jgi:hypothetical protein
MDKSNPEVYPITRSFEDWWEEEMTVLRVPPASAALSELYRICRENIGEYEHGSADVEDLFDTAGLVTPESSAPLVRAYAEVCKDIILTFIQEGQS